MQLPTCWQTGRLLDNKAGMLCMLTDWRMHGTVLGAVMGATIAWFSCVDRLAAILLVPYLGWTFFATVLVSSISTDNQQVG